MIIEIQGYTIDTKEIESISSISEISRHSLAFFIYMKSKMYFTITLNKYELERLESLHSQVVECFRGIKEIHKIN